MDSLSSQGSTPTPSSDKPPFESFSLNLVQRHGGRSLFRMTAEADGMFAVHVEKGSADRPSVDFTRTVPLSTAEQLRDNMARLGVFDWEASYGDDVDPGSRRWVLSLVFEADVFSITCRGGSSVPRGFDELLECLYQMDFPRPVEPQTNATGAGMGGTSMDEVTRMFKNFGLEGMGGLDGGSDADMAAALEQIQQHPDRLFAEAREGFMHMPPDQQNQMLDMLASTGIADRAWWERFLRG